MGVCRVQELFEGLNDKAKSCFDSSSFKVKGILN